MQSIVLFFKGIGIGIANLIPGVSGGTLALIFNVFERLIGSIKSISSHTVSVLFGLIIFRKGSLAAFREEYKRIDATFLLTILLGMGVAILSFSKLMAYLIVSFHDQTYAFFFGLIIVSIYVPLSLIHKWDWKVVIMLLLAVAGIVAMTCLQTDAQKILSAETEISIKMGQADQAAAGLWDYLLLVLSGALAISTMILPGISGSFVLLLMGKYFLILQAVATLDMPVLMAFGIGLIVGVVVFSRVFHAIMKKWYNETMGFLSGLVIGSLWAVWPFQGTHVLSNGETLYLSNYLPKSFGIHELTVLAIMVASGLLVAVMIRIGNKNNKESK